MHSLLPIIALSILLSLCAHRTSAQFGSTDSGGPLNPLQAACDIRHYEIDLAIHPDRKSIAGSSIVSITTLGRIDTLLLDFDSRLEVQAVQLNQNHVWKGVQYTHVNGQLRVVLPKSVPSGTALRIRTDYAGVPLEAHQAPWEGGFVWRKSRDGKPWIAFACQGEGADIWFPCKDHPSDEPDSATVRLTIPNGLRFVGNGTLRNTEPVTDSTTAWTWFIANPINNYNITVNVAPYELLEYEFTSVTGKNVPVHLYVLPESKAKAEKQAPQFLDHLRFFEKYCGPYPFQAEKYAVVETPYLGMEHQTAIAYGSTWSDNNFGFDWLHHHELAHEWWGNLVSVRDWSDFWIHEGIGTYMQALYAEERSGIKDYHRFMRSVRMWQEQRPIAPRKALTAGEAYSSSVYNKGAWIVHTLRYLVGDDAFFTILRRWAYPSPEDESRTDRCACRFTDSNEFQAIAEKHSGMKLDWFFDAYLRQAASPELVTIQENGMLKLEWLTTSALPFSMPVPARIGNALHRVEMPNGKGSIACDSTIVPAIDPENWVTKKIGRRGTR